MRIRRLLMSMTAPVVAVVFAVTLSSAVLVVAGTNPLEAWREMLAYGTRLETLVATANRATPLYLAGIAVAIGFRMNLFNIGVEGQYVLAALLAASVGAAVDLPPVLHVLLIMGVAMSVGSLYAGVAGYLKVTRGVHEVISTIMLNAVALSLVGYLLRTQLLDRADTSLNLKTPEGQGIAHALIVKADGLLHNMRGDAPKRLGIDYATAKKLNPGLVYLYCGSYGSTGPGAGRGARQDSAPGGLRP